MRKPKCFICGEVRDDFVYFWWHGKSWCHAGCAIECDFTINHQDKDTFDALAIEKIITEKDIEILKKKAGYVDYLTYKVYSVRPMNREMIRSYILGRFL